MKRSQPRRYWQDARKKLEAEGRCRLHRTGGCEGPLECAHSVSRTLQDKGRPSGRLYVNPDSIVVLCRHHHKLHDAHELDVLPYMTLGEQIDAVVAAGSIASAYRRLAPNAYRREAA